MTVENKYVEEDIKSIPFGKKYCECRCGELIDARDDHGRYKRYKVGHNRRGKKTIDPIYVEVDKITSISQFKDIVITQAKIIQELQRWKDERTEG